MKGPAHWGVGRDAADGVADDVVKKDFADFLINAEGINAAMPPEHKIVSIADLVYSRAKDTATLTDRCRVDYANYSFCARGGSNGATTSLKQKQWLGYTPSDGKVKIGTVTGNYPMQADTVTDDEFSGMIADSICATLQYNDASMMALTNNYAGIQIKAGSQLEMNKDEANLWAKTIRVGSTAGSKHKITVSESGIVLCGLNVNGSRLSSNDPLHIDGQLIKIG